MNDIKVKDSYMSITKIYDILNLCFLFTYLKINTASNNTNVSK